MTIVKVFKIDSKVIKYLKMGGWQQECEKSNIFTTIQSTEYTVSVWMANKGQTEMTS